MGRLKSSIVVASALLLVCSTSAVAEEAEFLPIETKSDRIIRFQRVHNVLAEVCGNRFLEAITKSMLRLIREIVEAVEPDHETLHMPDEHRRIVQSVISEKPEEAAAAMTKHLDKFCDSLIRMEAAYRRNSTSK